MSWLTLLLAPARAEGDDFADTHVIAAFTSCSPPASILLSTYTFERLDPLPACAATYTVPAGLAPSAAVTALSGIAGVSWAELDRVRTLQWTPNDPDFEAQWSFHDLAVEAAWAIGAGDGVLVAIIDSGVEEGEDGLHDLQPGWNFWSDDDDTSDPELHGSHVAATVNQQTHNATRFAGIAHLASIVPASPCDPDGRCYASRVARAIAWSVDQGAQVINLSLGARDWSTVESEALAEARAAGVVVVAAAGNAGASSVLYPARTPQAVAVGALGCGAERASYSNRGEGLDLVAPGGAGGCGIRQNVPALEDYSLSGTSMAAAHVTGAAAILVGLGATADEAEETLRSTALDLGDPGWDPSYGWGALRIGEAVSSYVTPFAWVAGNGNGTFAWWTLDDGDHQRTADFDGDGRDEVLLLQDPAAHLYTWSGSHWAVRWGTGGGAIGPWTMHLLDRYLPGDFDGDGAAELLVIYGDDAMLLGWSGTGFTEAWSTDTGWIGGWEIAAEDQYIVADLDGDGADELLAVEGIDARVLGYGGLGWNTHWSDASGALGTWTTDPADRYVVADLDGDGADEVVAARDPEAAVLAWDGDDLGTTWSASTGWLGDWELGEADQLFAADRDGDGAAELYAVNAPSILAQRHDGEDWSTDWGHAAGLIELWWLDPLDDPLPGDFDQDGQDDLLMMNTGWWHLMLAE